MADLLVASCPGFLLNLHLDSFVEFSNLIHAQSLRIHSLDFPRPTPVLLHCGFDTSSRGRLQAWQARDADVQRPRLGLGSFGAASGRPAPLPRRRGARSARLSGLGLAAPRVLAFGRRREGQGFGGMNLCQGVAFRFFVMHECCAEAAPLSTDYQGKRHPRDEPSRRPAEDHAPRHAFSPGLRQGSEAVRQKRWQCFQEALQSELDLETDAPLGGRVETRVKRAGGAAFFKARVRTRAACFARTKLRVWSSGVPNLVMLECTFIYIFLLDFIVFLGSWV